MTHAQAHPPSCDPPEDLPYLTPELLKLKLRLSPLIQVEEILTKRLTPAGSMEVGSLGHFDRPKITIKEVAVNSTAQWREAFNRLRANTRESFDSEHAIDWDDPNDPGVVLSACSEDIIRLWNEPLIRKLLEKQNLRLEEMGGL